MQTVTTATRIAVTVARSCARCELPLEDPASVQSGLGPICRGFASKVLAKELPSAWSDDALSAFFLLGTELFEGEDRARFEPVYFKILNSKGASTAGVTGEDWRAVVKELAYFASAAPSRAVYEAILGAIRGIGYPEYAAAVEGASSSGEATLSFENGRVYLKAVRNPAGIAALRRMGSNFDARTERRWVLPEKAHSFVGIARLYWPLVKGAEETLAAAAQAPAAPALVAPAPVVAPAPAAPAVVVALVLLPTEIQVSSPYAPGFIRDLKALPVWRRWEPSLPAWRIGRSAEAQVRALIATHYPEATVTEAHAA